MNWSLNEEIKGKVPSVVLRLLSLQAGQSGETFLEAMGEAKLKGEGNRGGWRCPTPHPTQSHSPPWQRHCDTCGAGISGSHSGGKLGGLPEVINWAREG